MTYYKAVHPDVRIHIADRLHWPQVAVSSAGGDLIAPDQRDALTAPIRTALPDLWADVTKHLPHDQEFDR